MADKKASKEYSGTTMIKFTVGSKKPVVYKVGSKFTTDSQSVYQDLLKKQIIK